MPRRKPTPHDETPDELRDASRGVRLHKAMADAGVASRRDCEDLIAQGRVKVNGLVVKTLPAWVDPENPPARACVNAQLARPEILVEIMVTAAK